MGTEWSPAKKRRQAKKRKREEQRWASRSSVVAVKQLCTKKGCDGSCGQWHRL